MGKQGDPLSLNLYTYCHNNPILYWDPSGHSVTRDWANEWYGYRKYSNEWYGYSLEDQMNQTLFKKKQSLPLNYNTYHYDKALNGAFNKAINAPKKAFKTMVATHRISVMAFQNSTKDINLTHTKSTSVYSSAIFIKGSASIGTSIDTKGNVAFQWSAGGGTTLEPFSLGITKDLMFTNATTVNELTGAGTSLGVSGNVGPISVGGSRVQGGDNVAISNSGIYGYSFSGGAGLGVSPVDISWQGTHTENIVSFNVYDSYYKLSNELLGW